MADALQAITNKRIGSLDSFFQIEINPENIEKSDYTIFQITEQVRRIQDTFLNSTYNTSMYNSLNEQKSFDKHHTKQAKTSLQGMAWFQA